MTLHTATSLSTWRTCNRKHYLRYVAGIERDRTSSALDIGTAVHAGLDSAKRGGDPMAGVVCFDEVDTVVARCLVAGWVWRWQTDPVRVIASEQSFRLGFGRGHRWRFAGKIDAIVEHDGETKVMEHKTTSDDLAAESDYWARLCVDGQISGYLAAARKLGHAAKSILYDVIRKPGIEPRAVPTLDADGVKIVLDAAGQRVRTADGKKWRQTADAALGYVLQSRPETSDEYGARIMEDIYARPERYYARRTVERLEGDMAAWRTETADTVRQINASRWPGIRNSGACIMFGRCQYLDLCRDNVTPTVMYVEDNDPLPAGFVRLKTLHPELENTDDRRPSDTHAAADVAATAAAAPDLLAASAVGAGTEVVV